MRLYKWHRLSKMKEQNFHLNRIRFRLGVSIDVSCSNRENQMDPRNISLFIATLQLALSNKRSVVTIVCNAIRNCQQEHLTTPALCQPKNQQTMFSLGCYLLSSGSSGYGLLSSSRNEYSAVLRCFWWLEPRTRKKKRFLLFCPLGMHVCVCVCFVTFTNRP